MGWPLRWKTSIYGGYLTVQFHSVIGFIDYTHSLLNLVQLCCLCDRTEIQSERTPVVPRPAAYYSLRHLLFWTGMAN